MPALRVKHGLTRKVGVNLKVERPARIELASPGWRPGALPLSYDSLETTEGLEPSPSGLRPAASPLLPRGHGTGGRFRTFDISIIGRVLYR